MDTQNVHYQNIMGVEITRNINNRSLGIKLNIDWTNPKSPTLFGYKLVTDVDQNRLEQSLATIKFLSKNPEIPIYSSWLKNSLYVEVGHKDFEFLNLFLCLDASVDEEGKTLERFWKLEFGKTENPR